jgi:hypothetical protein
MPAQYSLWRTMNYNGVGADLSAHEGTIMKKDEDPGILQAALLGYQQQLEVINGKIAELKRRLGGRSAAPTAVAARPPQKKHRISPEGRARIAAAQRKRWAAAKKTGS